MVWPSADAKVQGEFVWHSHEGEDELFLVLRGRFNLRLRDGEVSIGPGVHQAHWRREVFPDRLRSGAYLSVRSNTHTRWGVSPIANRAGFTFTICLECSMNHVLRFAFLTACLLGVSSLTAAAQDVDVTGDWEITFESPRGVRVIPITFAQEGSTVTGSTEMGGGAAEIRDGKIEGNTLTFKIVMNRGERTMRQIFTATVTGDAMEGTIEMAGGMGGGGRGGGGPRPFTAKRVEG